ncbi:MAG: hypothetical protein HOP00_01235 [Nitrospira sp.]|nr:hypothetical protein [Nitrospira sp.]
MIETRPADLKNDRSEIIELVQRHLDPQSGEERFEWLYLDNPHGPARVWLAIDLDNRSVVGMGAAFPRKVFTQESERTGWVLGDFCLDGRYRSLGPALQLQKAILAEVDAGDVSFCYDFPSKSMMAVLSRLRAASMQEMVRMVMPLRVDLHVRRFVANRVSASVLSDVGNFGLWILTRAWSVSSSVEVDSHHGLCGNEFSRLAKEIGGRRGVCVYRSADYLNWRYLRNPLREYHLLTARRNGRLDAYAVYACNGDEATLHDLFGGDDPTVIKSLIIRLVHRLVAQGVMSLTVPLLATHPWLSLLESLWFRRRESTPVFLYWSRTVHVGFSGEPWWLMQGDRDS